MLSEHQKIYALEREVLYLRQEIEFFKKIQKSNNLLSITELCEIAGVSRSGYYRYLNASDVRETKETQDKADFELILAAYNYSGYNKGARSIHMRLLHLETPVIMNIKKIRLTP